MARKGENIYKRKDGRWEGRYKKGVDAQGKIKWGYVYSTSYHETRQKLYPLKLQSMKQVAMGNTSAQTLAEWGFQYLKEAHIKASTYASYQHKLQRYLIPHIGHYGLNELTTERLQALIQTWEAHALSASSIHTNFAFLSSLLNKAVKQKQLAENPCHGVARPPRTQPKVSALSRREEAQLRQAAQKAELRQGACVLLALETGMRIGEIAALKWTDIDFEENLIRVTHTYQRVTNPIGAATKTRLLYSEPKTPASKRVIPMTNLVKQVLTRLREANQQEFVFVTQGKACEPRLLTYHFQKICQAAQVDQLHFHQLRHSFATRCLEKSADIVSVSALLGHSSTKMTLDVYADSHIEQQRHVIHLLDVAI